MNKDLDHLPIDQRMIIEILKEKMPQGISHLIFGEEQLEMEFEKRMNSKYGNEWEKRKAMKVIEVMKLPYRMG